MCQDSLLPGLHPEIREQRRTWPTTRTALLCLGFTPNGCAILCLDLAQHPFNSAAGMAKKSVKLAVCAREALVHNLSQSATVWQWCVAALQCHVQRWKLRSQLVSLRCGRSMEVCPFQSAPPPVSACLLTRQRQVDSCGSPLLPSALRVQTQHPRHCCPAHAVPPQNNLDLVVYTCEAMSNKWLNRQTAGCLLVVGGQSQPAQMHQRRGKPTSGCLHPDAIPDLVIFV